MVPKGSRILVTGGSGFLGSFVVEALQARGYRNLYCPRSAGLDLREKAACERAVKGVDVVVHLAGNVGGIQHNIRNPGAIFYDNAAMALHLIEASRKEGVRKFVAAGTVCAYPKHTPVPFRESDLWNGYPDETNAAYGLSKKMMLVQLQAYRQQYGFNGVYLLLENMYGPGDNFNPESSHVIPALIRRVREAKAAGTPSIEAWGDGSASREFLYVRDGAEAIVAAMENYEKGNPVNVGSGREVTIRELVEAICRVMKYPGKIAWDPSKPAGQPRRGLDTSKAEAEFGFRSKTGLEQGLKETVEWYEGQLGKKLAV